MWDKNETMKLYYIILEEQQLGPFNIHELAQHTLTKSTLVWYEGLEDWTPAGTVEELRPLLHSVPPPLKKENTAVQNEGVAATFLWGMRKVRFFTLAAITVVLLVFLSFQYQQMKSSRIDRINRETESQNRLVEEEMKAQKEKMDEEKRIAQQRKLEQDRKKIKDQVMVLKSQYQLIESELLDAQATLNDVSGFKLLRSGSQRKAQIAAATQRVEELEKNKAAIVAEMKLLMEQLSRLE